MNKKIPILFLLLFTLGVYSQTIIPSGNLSLKSGAQYDFVNLRIEGDKVSFNDVATNKTLAFQLTEIKSMQGKALSPEEAAKAEAARKVAVVDTRFRPNYPEGIYRTKLEFINKTPGSTEKVISNSLEGYDVELSEGQQFCFFRSASSGNKIKNAFAISHKGFLYFQLEAVVKNTGKGDGGQSNEQYNQFIRVIDGGENYYYLEAELASQWAQAGVYGALGVIAGSAVNPSLFSLKGIIWDFEKKEFNIFRNCKDFNSFITPKWPEGVIQCKQHYADILKVRHAISQIK